MKSIKILPTIDNKEGAYYNSGFIKEKYVHFIAHDSLNKKQIKSKLVDIYNKEQILEKSY